MAKQQVVEITHALKIGQQYVAYEQIVMLNGKKVRVQTKADTYDFQSSCFAEVWSETELKWNKVHSIHYSHMTTKYRGTRMSIADFTKDNNKLLDIVSNIIS